MYKSKFRVGPQSDETGWQSRIWAPSLSACRCLIFDNEFSDDISYRIDYVAENDGFFSTPPLELADRVIYQIELEDGTMIPDPFGQQLVSNVHGRSLFVPVKPLDNTTKSKLPTREEYIIYELHIGTFTEEGTLRSCANKIPQLAALGFTALQLMPIFSTPGERNWGYDCVSFFTLNQSYGTLGDVQELIACAHAHGMSVILDVVFNHLGSEGNYLEKIAPSFMSIGEQTPWGPSLNLLGPDSEVVKSIVLQSVNYWLMTVGFDGLRIDASHYLCPDGDKDFLMSLSDHAHLKKEGSSPFLILEHDPFEFQFHDCGELIQKGQYDGVWNSTFAESASEFACGRGSNFFDVVSSSLYAFENDQSARLDVLMGSILFFRSHDTIGNRGNGSRNHNQNPLDVFALQEFMLLSPFIPMIFMGDEWLSDNPYFYFCDIKDTDDEQLSLARQNEFPEISATCPTPLSIESFERSKLNWHEATRPNAVRQLERLKFLIDTRKKYVIPFLKNGILNAKIESDDNSNHCRLIFENTSNEILIVDARNSEQAWSATDFGKHSIYESNAISGESQLNIRLYHFESMNLIANEKFGE